MIEVTPAISIPDSAIEESFIRSSGPGGQHVNKTSTGVQLRFDTGCDALPGEVRRRLKRLAGNRMTEEGVLIIEATQSRSQKANREDALDRLIALIRQAEKPPKPRKKTRPSRAAKERRLDAKRKQSEKKRSRGSTRDMNQ